MSKFYNFYCFRWPPKRPVTAPNSSLWVSCGRVRNIKRADTVRVFHDDDYEVVNIKQDGRVVLRKAGGDSRRSFTRHPSEVHVPPPPYGYKQTQTTNTDTSDLMVQVNEPTENCLCSPEPPKIIPDTADAATQCEIDADKFVAVVCRDITSVRELRQQYIDAEAEREALELQVAALKDRLQVLNEENASLLKRTMSLSSDVTALKEITTSQRHAPVLQRMLFQQLQQFPLKLDPYAAPKGILFKIISCPPSASLETVKENIKTILNIIHPDKNPAAPAHVSKYCPLLAFVKSTLVNEVNLQVYRCCDMDGITRRQEGLCSCRKCDPFLIDLWGWGGHESTMDL